MDGWSVFGRMLYAVNGFHGFEWMPFAWALACVVGGALLIQTGNVKDALDIVKSAWPFFREVKPGGERKTDPPAEPKP